MLAIGPHLSIRNGFSAMGKEAVSLHADTFQFFLRSPRGGTAKEISGEDVQGLREILHAHGFPCILAHAPYTLNPCGKGRVQEYARMVMQDDLGRMESFFPGNLYNFHPGCHVGQGAEEGIRRTAQMLNEILWKDMHTTVLIETMSGKGSEIGCTFEQIRALLDQIQLQEKVGVCLDTCHAWDAGYDLREHLSDVLEEFDRVIGLERLKAVHLNDSMNPCGSRRDRHEKLGKGCLGKEAIRSIVREPRLKSLPFYLETPNDLDGYKKEIRMVRRMAEEAEEYDRMKKKKRGAYDENRG